MEIGYGFVKRIENKSRQYLNLIESQYKIEKECFKSVTKKQLIVRLR